MKKTREESDSEESHYSHCSTDDEEGTVDLVAAVEELFSDIESNTEFLDATLEDFSGDDEVFPKNHTVAPYSKLCIKYDRLVHLACTTKK